MSSGSHSNFSAFKSNRNHRYVGGRAAKSPVRLQIPNSGHWYVVVHFGGLTGKCRYSVEVLPGALPTMRQTSAPSLTPIGEEVASMLSDESSHAERDWDVFISHATEDKEEVVRPLAEALQGSGLRVWYDELTRSGDSLRRKIDGGSHEAVLGSSCFRHHSSRRTGLSTNLTGLSPARCENRSFCRCGTSDQTGSNLFQPITRRQGCAEYL